MKKLTGPKLMEPTTSEKTDFGSRRQHSKGGT
jgi:hypothetical protein